MPVQSLTKVGEHLGQIISAFLSPGHGYGSPQKAIHVPEWRQVLREASALPQGSPALETAYFARLLLEAPVDDVAHAAPNDHVCLVAHQLIGNVLIKSILFQVGAQVVQLIEKMSPAYSRHGLSNLHVVSKRAGCGQEPLENEQVVNGQRNEGMLPK